MSKRSEIMSRSRRPSVSIYDYPEHLNPFKDDAANPQSQITRESKTKDGKHKFWTFGRSRKRSSNSFSIKSTWNGLFGKRKDASDPREKRATITTVSSTYKREPSFEGPVAAPRISRDQREFDEALDTLARRRKYTMDESSRCNSSLTVNGDPARIYDGSPKNTTASIMGDLTPKAPARRFGQVSPRPTDKIPPLNYGDKEHKENGEVTLREKPTERTPVPPMRRFGNRSSQRLNAGTLDSEDEASRSRDASMRDENENVPDDYVFKRFSQDAVRRSNLSINSCVSVTSTASTYGRKKRRAPQPPKRVEQLETPTENEAIQNSEAPKVELQIVEPIDIVRVTENIDEMTKKSRELENTNLESEQKEKTPENISVDTSEETSQKYCEEILEDVLESVSHEISEKETPENTLEKMKSETEETSEDLIQKNDETIENPVQIEYHRSSQEKIEIIKDVDRIDTPEELEVCLRQKSNPSLSRSDSFSVKDEIEKIERQIKALEIKNASRDSMNEEETTSHTNGRSSLEANRRHFFKNMVDNKEYGNGVKIELKELPREQKDIHVIRLTDPPVPVDAPREPVKVIELHISEPIKQKPELVDDVNPIPKPRRHSSLSLNHTETPAVVPSERKSLQVPERGKSF